MYQLQKSGGLSLGGEHSGIEAPFEGEARTALKEREHWQSRSVSFSSHGSRPWRREKRMA
jgi:hypothetical protein